MSYTPNPTDGTEPLDTVDRSTAAAEFRALKSYIQQTLSTVNSNIAAATNPAGTIISFSGTIAPAGYIACPTAPTNISRTAYPNLFNAIGTTWGIGDGVSTFGMPWFPAGYVAVHGPGSVGGQTVGEVISHDHSYTEGVAVAAQWGTAGNTAYPPAGGTTGATGGNANYAAGSYILMCVKT